ncbi:MAG: AraC family transcriptional regulator [Polyangiales bacterium]
MRVVGALLEAAEHAGARREELLEASGIAFDQLEPLDARIAEADISHMCELALDRSGDPALGLHWGERLTVDTFVPVSYLVTHAPTLGEALESLSRYSPLLTDAPTFTITQNTHHVTISCLPRKADALRARRFVAEISVLGFVHVVRCFQAQWQPEHVSFEYAKPDYHDEYTRVFDHAARFDQPYTGLRFDRAYLQLPSRHKDEGIYTSLRALADQRLRRLKERDSYAALVSDKLAQDGRLVRGDMEGVAAALGLSVRSLRRHLAAEGKSYTSIVSDTFISASRRLLLEEARTIQQTAYALGFSSSTAFHRAFKRATGLTPSAFVDTHLGRSRA